METKIGKAALKVLTQRRKCIEKYRLKKGKTQKVTTKEPKEKKAKEPKEKKAKEPKEKKAKEPKEKKAKEPKEFLLDSLEKV